MSARPAPAGGWRELELLAAVLAALVLGPLTLLLALLAAWAFEAAPRRLLPAALAPGCAGTYLLAGRMHAELVGLARSLHGRPLDRPGPALDVAWPHLWPLWLSTVALAPLVGLLLALRRRSLLDSDPDLSARTAIERSERGIARRSALPDPPRAEIEGAAFLGYRLRGDPLLPTRRGRVYLPLGRLGHHLLVVGATGSGKTESVLRLVDSVARSSDWRIVFLDGKGDHETAERFSALATASGRRVWRFPEAAYDGWRGDGAEIAGRLLQLVDFAESGGGTYYRDLAVNAVRLACAGSAGPPRSSRELLRRLRGEALAELHPSGSLEATEIAGLNRGQLDGIRARYAAFFATVGSTLDGQVAFEEIDSAYFLLDGLRLKHEAGYLARFLVEEFTQWAAGRKPRPQRVLLVVDEFSAIATAGKGLVDVVERMRAFGVAAVLCPQVAEGMGGFEAASRLIGSAQTILLHALPNPERFVEVAGGRRVALTSHQLDGDAPTGFASTRPGHEQRIDPDEVRRLKPGQCFAIGSGLALKLQIARMPSPQAQPASR